MAQWYQFGAELLKDYWKFSVDYNGIQRKMNLTLVNEGSSGSYRI
jgi:hydrogenase maturation factor